MGDLSGGSDSGCQAVGSRVAVDGAACVLRAIPELVGVGGVAAFFGGGWVAGDISAA